MYAQCKESHRRYCNSIPEALPAEAWFSDNRMVASGPILQKDTSGCIPYALLG